MALSGRTLVLQAELFCPSSDKRNFYFSNEEMDQELISGLEIDDRFD